MNTYRYEPSTRNQLSRFAQRQPGIFLAATVAGGFLLGYWLRGSRRRSAYDHYAGSFTENAWHETRPATSAMSSARLGATEDQMAPASPPSSAQASPKDAVSTTGAAYELDPNSITGG